MNVFRNIKDNRDTNYIVFIIIAVFYLFGNLLWYKLNTPIIIQGIYNNYFAKALMEGEFFFDIAPLIVWIMRSFLHVFGNNYFDLEIIFINYFFFLVALYFINKICIEIKNKETGTIAMLLFALTPAIYGASRQYGHHDYHIMCVSLLNMYALIKLEDFTNRKWSVIYGISVGIGLMIKDAFAAYFFIPALYVGIRSLMEQTENKKQKIINILITMSLGCLIVGWHYFKWWIFKDILKGPFVEPSQYPYLSFENFRIFTIGIGEYLLSLPLFLFFILSMFWYVLKYKNKKYKNIFLLWFFVPWTILMFMRHHRLPDYGLGLVPIIIIVISLYISNIKKTVFKRTILIFLITICLLQYISFSYGKNMELFNLKIHLKGYDFYYFNKNYNFDGNSFPSIMFYDHIKRNCCLSVVQYLKNNFNNNTIYIYKDMLTDIFTMEDLCTSLKLQNHRVIMNLEKVLDADIIVFTKRDSFISSNYLIERQMEEFSDHLISYDYKDLKNYITAKINEINNKYIKLDEFDLYSDNLNAQNCIIVLGKKDLFENGGELKYKYRYLTSN